MITRIPLFAVQQAAKLAKAKARAQHALSECLRDIDRDDPLFDRVLSLYRDAQTLGAFGVFFKAAATGSPT